MTSITSSVINIASRLRRYTDVVAHCVHLHPIDRIRQMAQPRVKPESMSLPEGMACKRFNHNVSAKTVDALIDIGNRQFHLSERLDDTVSAGEQLDRFEAGAYVSLVDAGNTIKRAGDTAACTRGGLAARKLLNVADALEKDVETAKAYWEEKRLWAIDNHDVDTLRLAKAWLGSSSPPLEVTYLCDSKQKHILTWLDGVEPARAGAHIPVQDPTLFQSASECDSESDSEYASDSASSSGYASGIFEPLCQEIERFQRSGGLNASPSAPIDPWPIEEAFRAAFMIPPVPAGGNFCAADFGNPDADPNRIPLMQGHQVVSNIFTRIEEREMHDDVRTALMTATTELQLAVDHARRFWTCMLAQVCSSSDRDAADRAVTYRLACTWLKGPDTAPVPA